MDDIVLMENVRRKKISSDELMVIVCPSDSEDGLENDYSDEDPTVEFSSLVPDSSDSEEKGPSHSERQFVPEKPAVVRRGPRIEVDAPSNSCNPGT
jgi:hypothetical protein